MEIWDPNHILIESNRIESHRIASTFFNYGHVVLHRGNQATIDDRRIDNAIHCHLLQYKSIRHFGWDLFYHYATNTTGLSSAFYVPVQEDPLASGVLPDV